MARHFGEAMLDAIGELSDEEARSLLVRLRSRTAWLMLGET